MITLHHNGQQVTAGQALDAFLATRTEYQLRCELPQWLMVFVEGLYGHCGPLLLLKDAGVEVEFGEKQ